jgi:hypothetical protein
MGDSRSSKAFAVIAVALIAGALRAEVTVTSLTPATGLTRGGEIVHIHGTNLLGAPLLCPSITCATYVKFGDTAFGEIVDNTAAEIVVIAPPHAAGRVDVQVNVPPNPPITLPSAFAYIDPPLTDRVLFLVPIVIDAAGAGGTKWVSELVVHNENSEALPLNGGTVPALATSIVRLNPSAGSAGSFLEVPRRLAGNVSASLRVHDTTRDGDSWGADVPVVPETQFRRSIVLPAVPADARYRTLLRVYGYAGHDTTATVTFRDDATGALLATRTLTTQAGYAQLPIDVTGAPRLRVQVTAAASLLWAFVSVTNNTTQQVTTITPTVTDAVAPPAALVPGHWGGNVCVDVTSTIVRVSAGCGFGSFPTPAVGADGRFEADGTFGISVGPAPPNPIAPPAHFSGLVQGTSMTLTVRGGSQTYGPWSVQLGDPTPCAGPCP